MNNERFQVGDVVEWGGGCRCIVTKLYELDPSCGYLAHDPSCPKGDRHCFTRRETKYLYLLVNFVTHVDDPFVLFVRRTLKEAETK